MNELDLVRRNYYPEVFDQLDPRLAKEIILSNDPTGKKWLHETEHTVDLMLQACKTGSVSVGPESLVLDYGCGVGRVAKSLIHRTGCNVLGTDISFSMLAMAQDYVRSERFGSLPKHLLERLVGAGQMFDCIYSVWVLQHALTPAMDIDLLFRALKPQGTLFVVNTIDRLVPIRRTTEACFFDDGVSIRDLLRSRFTSLGEYSFVSDSKMFCESYTR